MWIIALTDIHGAARMVEEVSGQLADADLVLIAGDITHFGRRAEAGQIIGTIEQHNPHILAVAGNCDHLEVAHYLSDRHMNLDTSYVVREGIAFVGAAGSLPCPGTTPNEVGEDGFSLSFSRSYMDVAFGTPSIFVVHQPPYGTITDLAHKDMHVGSRSVREAIERHKPLICFCGHIHESSGMDKIGDTLIVNPGPLRHGRFAVAEVVDGKVTECRLEAVSAR